MHSPNATPSAARRELVVVATLLVALSLLVAPAEAPIVAALLPVAVLLAGLGVLRAAGAVTRPYASLLLPALLTGGTVASLHLVPPGLWLLVALAAFAVVVDLVLALEMGIAAQPNAVNEGDQARVLVAAVVTVFIAFTGVAALVPGGMPEPTASQTAGSSAMTQGWLLVLAAADAVAGLVVGWRISALRFGAPLEIARSAVTYGLVVAISAGLIRAIDLPRLVGPAVLTLVFYLWDAQHGSAPARRRERRFVWEMLLLGGLAILVMAWNLRVER